MKFSEKILRDRLSKRKKTLVKVRKRLTHLVELRQKTIAKWQKAHDDETAELQVDLKRIQAALDADGKAKQASLNKEQQPLVQEGAKLEKEVPRLEAQIAELQELLGDEEASPEDPEPEVEAEEVPEEETSNVTEIRTAKTSEEELPEEDGVDYSADVEEEDEDDSDLDAILSRT